MYLSLRSLLGLLWPSSSSLVCHFAIQIESLINFFASFLPIGMSDLCFLGQYTFQWTNCSFFLLLSATIMQCSVPLCHRVKRCALTDICIKERKRTSSHQFGDRLGQCEVIWRQLTRSIRSYSDGLKTSLCECTAQLGWHCSSLCRLL